MNTILEKRIREKKKQQDNAIQVDLTIVDDVTGDDLSGSSNNRIVIQPSLLLNFNLILVQLVQITSKIIIC